MVRTTRPVVASRMVTLNVVPPVGVSSTCATKTRSVASSTTIGPPIHVVVLDAATGRVEHDDGAVCITHKRAVCVRVGGHEDAATTPIDGESGRIVDGNGRDRRPGCGVE